MLKIGQDWEKHGKVTLPRGAFLNHLQRHYPQATLDLDRKQLFFGLGGELISRTADELSPEEIDLSLQGIEDYVASILYANPENPQLAQRSVMEALLYILCTPFHSHYMRNNLYNRGPTAIYKNYMDPDQLDYQLHQKMMVYRCSNVLMSDSLVERIFFIRVARTLLASIVRG